MIITDSNSSQKPLLQPYASSSTDPPPSFEDAVGGEMIPPPANQPHSEDAPPPFSLYHPTTSTTGWHGSVVCLDPHLNKDGEALFRFLLSQSMIRPDFYLHILGKHSERRSRTVWRKGKLEHDDYMETVTDFDFLIDIGQFLLPESNHGGPVYYSAADNEPCYRGSQIRQISLPSGGTRKSSRQETRDFKKWLQDSQSRGLPPWVTGAHAWQVPASDEEAGYDGTLRSSRTIRDWADEYCVSDKVLKEFVFDKMVCGWNLAQLERVIRESIGNTLYQGDVQVEFETRKARVYVRPDNHLSRVLSNGWLKVLLIILLIYPFIWLFKRYHRRGGGKWQVSGACYFMKRWVLVPPWDPDYRFMNDKSLVVGSYDSSRRFVRTADGMKKLVGMRESEWYRDWEPTIMRAVRQHHVSKQPITTLADTPASARDLLE